MTTKRFLSPLNISGTFALIVSSFYTFPQTIQAQVTNPAISDEFGQHPGTTDGFGERFGTIFVYFWNLLITVGTLLFFAMFLLGAIEWISAGGDKSKVDKARERITQSVVGLFILVCSFVILSIINTFVFGSTFDIFELYFPSPGP